MRCGSSRSSSTAPRPGRWPRPCTRRSPPHWTPPRTGPPREIVGWVAQHATTRVGPRDRQVQVPVEQLEAAVIRHYTSRAGDPHRHLHLQINARVWAAGGVAGYPFGRDPRSHRGDQRDRARRRRHRPGVPGGTRRARVHPRPRDQRDPASSRRTSGRSVPGPRRSAATSTGTRPSGGREHPGEEPGLRLREAWDRRAWAQARPDKVVPTDGRDLVARWNSELRDLGYRDPDEPVAPAGNAAGVDRPRRRRRAGRLHPRRQAVGVEHRRHSREDRGPPRRRPAWSPTRPRGSSSPRTSPPGPRHGASGCWRDPMCPSTSGRSPRRRFWTSKPTSSPGSPRAGRAAGPTGPTWAGGGLVRIDADPSSGGRRPGRRRPAGGGRRRRRRREDHRAADHPTDCSPSKGTGWSW